MRCSDTSIIIVIASAAADAAAWLPITSVPDELNA
jgi:hypothetical protein